VAGGEHNYIDPKKLSGWRLLKDFHSRLESITAGVNLHPTFQDPRRRLLAGDYLSLFLFGLLNPTVRTLRGLSAASKIQRIQEEVCRAPVSLGSYSEAQHLLDPELLNQLVVAFQINLRVIFRIVPCWKGTFFQDWVWGCFHFECVEECGVLV